MSSARINDKHCAMEVNLDRSSAALSFSLLEREKNDELNADKILVKMTTWSGTYKACTQGSMSIIIDKRYAAVLESFLRQTADKVAAWGITDTMPP